MKHRYAAVPPRMAGMETYGFSWMDFLTAIPSPLFVVTTWKSNGMANACLQSWASFCGTDRGFYAVLSNVSKAGHLYQSLLQKKEAVLNFPSADLYDRCMATVQGNAWEQDEITSAGLTLQKAEQVDAPCIDECFLQLECRLKWEHPLDEGDTHALVCLEVVSVCMDEEHLTERYGENGYLYNVHYPVNPQTYDGRSGDWLAVLKPIRHMGDY